LLFATYRQHKMKRYYNNKNALTLVTKCQL
jgi:hypothetical protein